MRGTRLVGCIVTLLSLVSCGAPAPSSPGGAASAQALATPTARTITVSGSASAMVVPDEVVLTLGVETTDPQVAAAKAKNDEIVGKVVEAAKGAGVEAKHVQTEYMRIEPRYQDNYTQRAFLGY